MDIYHMGFENITQVWCDIFKVNRINISSIRDAAEQCFIFIFSNATEFAKLQQSGVLGISSH